MSIGTPQSEQDLDQLATLFRLLADKTRLNILMALSGGEQNVTALCQRLGLPQPTVSHHLGLLRSKKVIGHRRNGKQVFYALNSQVDVSLNHAVRIGVDRYNVEIAPSVPVA